MSGFAPPSPGGKSRPAPGEPGRHRTDQLRAHRDRSSHTRSRDRGRWRRPNQDGTAQASQAKVQGASDWLTLLPASGSDSSQSSIAASWQPASRAGGGAALPPRGGSGNAAQAAAVALVQGHAAPLKLPPPPVSTPPIPFLPSAGGTASGPIANGARGGGGHPQRRREPSGPGRGSSSGHSVADSVSGGGSSVIAENPSSLPSSTVGNGSGSPLISFPYFPLYVLDENNGIILFNNQYQQATSTATSTSTPRSRERASTYTFSWNTSNLNSVSSLTAPVHTTCISNGRPPRSRASRIGNPDCDERQQPAGEPDFLFRGADVERGHVTSSASWPVTISPDLVEPGAPAIASQDVSVDANSGALDASIALPSYNPNVPALALTYDSLTADPRPIIVVHHTLDPTQSVPTAVNATLTFNSMVGTTWYYNTSQFTPGDVQQIALQANATSLSTGRYATRCRSSTSARPTRPRPTPARPRCSTSRPAPSATAGRSRAWSRSPRPPAA